MTLNFSGNSINLTESEAIALQSVLAKMLAAGKTKVKSERIVAIERCLKQRPKRKSKAEIIEEYTIKLIPHLKNMRIQ